MGTWIKAVLFAALIVAVVVGMWNYSGEKTIDAGDIELFVGPLSSEIKGSFTVSTPKVKRRTIPSQGTGGACLVANLNPGKPNMSGIPGGRCSKNSDCQQSLNPGWAGYCDQGTGICWVRPGTAEQFCNLSRFVTPPTPPIIWEDGIKYPTPKLYFQLRSPSAIDWRVVACLNQIDPATGKDSKLHGCGAQIGAFEVSNGLVTGYGDGKLKLQVFGKTQSVNYGPQGVEAEKTYQPHP
jgi:hypothetical protein